MRKIIFATAMLCLLLSGIVFAQDDQPKQKATWKSRVFFGGSGGVSVSGNISVINVSPIVGYRVTDKFHAGLGLRYIHYSQPSRNFSDTRYGGNLFTRYYVMPQFYLHGEYDVLRTTYYDTRLAPPQIITGFVPSVMIGGGYMQAVGRRSGVGISLLYIVNHNPVTSPYGNSPIVLRVGFVF